MRERLPVRQDLAPVLAVIAAVLYGWAIVVFFWKLPAWLLSLQVDEVLVLFAYMLATMLLASLLFLGFLMLLCAVLPASWLRDDFAVRGSYLSLCFWGVMAGYVGVYSEFGGQVYSYYAVFLLAGIALGTLFSYLSTQVEFLRRFMLGFADRLIVFLYVLIPLSVISFVVILFRNLF